MFRLMFVLILAVPALAGAVNLPVTKVPVDTRSFAEAVERGDANVLNASRAEILQMVQDYHPQAGLTSTRELPEYIRNLVVRPMARGERMFSRISISERHGRKIEWFWRDVRPGEHCLVDRNLEECIFSASCGNVVKPRTRHVRRPPPRVVREVVVVQAPPPLPQLQPAFGMNALGYRADHTMGTAHMGVRAARERRPDEYYFHQDIQVPVDVRQNVDVDGRVNVDVDQSQTQDQGGTIIFRQPPSGNPGKPRIPPSNTPGGPRIPPSGIPQDNPPRIGGNPNGPPSDDPDGPRIPDSGTS